MLTSIRDWASAIVPIFNLFLILIGANRVLRIAQRDYDERGKRLADLEGRVHDLEVDARLVVGVNASVADIREEIKRTRDRLDSFLDGKLIHSKE